MHISLCQFTGLVPNSQVQFQIKKPYCSDMEARVHGGKIHEQHGAIDNNTSLRSASSLKQAISAMEFERPEIEGEVPLKVARSRSMAAVEDACKQFRNYVIEMVAEDKNVDDLMDVEELLYCYQNITCPVYRDLLSQFYAQICSDIFLDSASSSSDDEESLSGSSIF